MRKADKPRDLMDDRFLEWNDTMRIHSLILILFASASCNPPPAATPNTPSKSGAKGTAASKATHSDTTASSELSPGTTADVKYTNSLASSTLSDLSKQDAHVLSNVKNSQGLLTSIGKISKRPVNATRMDEFYKCETYLSDSFFTPNPSPTGDNSTMTLATQMKNSFVVISKDVLKDKIGAYENYSVAVDSTGIIFVFFTTNSTQDVFYAWQDPKTSKWSVPVTLTGVSGFKGLPSASYDANAQKIVVQVFNTTDRKLYTYNQTSGTSFKVDTTTPTSALTELDKMQATNGTTLETNFNISLNSITPVQASSSIMTRLMNDVMTLGIAEIATALHTEEQSQAAAVFADIETVVCPPAQ